MVQSMTGFGRAQLNSDNYEIVAEIKSVNHRFKDFRFKIPGSFAPLEFELKEILSQHFNRGSFDIFLKVKKSSKSSPFDDLDQNKMKSYLKSLSDFIASSTQNISLQVSPADFLRSEFFKDQEEGTEDVLFGLVKQSILSASEQLKIARKNEGKKLIAVIQGHLQDYCTCFAQIEAMADQFQEHVEKKIKTKLDELARDMKVDEPRFAQEVIYYLERIDIHEEINRIKSHVDKMKKLLASDEDKGRQIDFIIQELNRETNTIGSKSNLSQVSDQVVQMKVNLEKMREQGLNLE